MKVWTGSALAYRTLEPEDAAAMWRACGLRDPRPSLAACSALLSEQLEVDERTADYLALDGKAATRRLLALADGLPVGLVTVEVPADVAGTVVVSVDPIESAWAGELEVDARSWVDRLGAANRRFTISAGAPREPIAERPLVFSQ